MCERYKDPHITGETERCSRIFTKPEKACAGMREALLTHHTENANLLVVTSPVS